MKKIKRKNKNTSIDILNNNYNILLVLYNIITIFLIKKIF